MMLQPWMGSDFANDDLVKESSIVNDYEHKILSLEKIGDHLVYKIELLPKPHAPVIWGKILRWIRKNDFVPIREEYYDENGSLIKVLQYTDIEAISDRTIPKVWSMVPVNKTGHSTVIKILDIEYDMSLSDDIFTLNNLKKIQ